MTDKEIADIYRDMELRLIESMKRNLALHMGEEAETQLEYPQWQAIKLRELRKYQKQNKDIIKRSLKGLPSDVAKLLRDELKQGHENEMKKFWKLIGEKKYRSAVMMNESFFKLNTRMIDNLISEVHESIYKAEHAALRMMNDTYRDVIAKAAIFQANGVATEAKAVDMATKDFLNRGLNCIEYSDGRRVNIADYCSMAVRTAQQRAYMMGEGEFRKSIGETLIIISRHNTACELCRPFESKVLIDDVYSGGKQSDGDYMLLSQAMKLGLFHPRCRHGLGTYYPELEDINGYETEDNKLNDYGSQQANEAHIDNMIQRYKRLTLGSLDPDNVRKYQERLEYWENRKNELAKPENVDNDGESGIIANERANKDKDGSYGVNWNVVNTDEYRKAFESISESPKVSKAIETRSKWALINRDSSNTEELYAVSLKTGDEIGRITNQHYEGAVKRTPHFDKALIDAKKRKDSILLIHNHPKGLPPSVTDINSLIGYKNNCGITIGHNGSIYYYTCPQTKIDVIDWKVAMMKFGTFSEKTAMEKSLEVLSQKYGFTFRILFKGE